MVCVCYSLVLIVAHTNHATKCQLFSALCVLERNMELNNKSKILRYLEDENISSVMNDTKWERLFQELKKIEWTLDFQRKDLDETNIDTEYWDGDLYHVFGSHQKIEWLNIRALLSKQKGVLVESEIEDNTAILLEALETSGVPYSKHGSGVRIWGYLRQGVSPEWENV